MSFRPYLIASAYFATAVLSAAVNITARDEPVLSWGSLGDSWNSGIAWSSETSWDNNRAGCLRAKRAYTGQMIDDRSWVLPEYGTRW
jgi:hypothetical protein